MLDLGGFNPEQHEAVVAESDPTKLKQLLILAGAGSGKTRVLTYRIAVLCKERGVDPSSVLAVTFTRKAANEMKDRLTPLVGQNMINNVELGTFHSIASNLLRGAGVRFVIIDDYDQKKLIKEIGEEAKEFKKVKPKQYLSWLSYQRSKCYDPLVPDGDDAEEIVVFRKLTAEYYRRKKQLRVVDFDDLLEMAVRLLRQYPEIKASYRAKWKYLLVDEYQDTNNRQFKLLSLIRGDDAQMFMVGDEDQLIYSWRGAEIRNILAAYQDAKQSSDCKCIVLNKNYRSVGNILTFADTIVSDNVVRTGKVMDPHKGNGLSIKVMDFDEEAQEMERIVRFVKIWKGDGVAYGEMAMLIRENRMSRNLEKAFLKAKIPYVIHAGLSLFERQETRLLLAILLFAENTHNSIYLSSITDIVKMSVGPAKVKKLRQASVNHGGCILEALRHDPVSQSNPIANNFVIAMDVIRDMLEEGKILSAAHVAVNKIDIIKFFKADTRENREENILTMYDVIEDYQHEAESPTVADFQEERLLNNELTEKGGKELVNIMTIHTAKGLEFQRGVFIGLQDGLVPKESVADSDDLEEDRRVAYVGITRFESELVVTRCSYRVGFDKVNAAGGTSSFFDKHLPKLIECGVVEHSQERSLWG